MLKTGMRIEGTIQSAKRGQGVMRHGKDTIFVRHAMPGEQVRVRIGKPLRDGWSASLDTVIKAHPHRIEPPCPLYARCGSCQLMHLDAQGQLQWKKEQIVREVNKAGLPLRVHDVVGMEDPDHYRNKMIIGFGRDEKGRPCAGLYEEFSHRIVPYRRCLMHPEACDDIAASILELMARFRIEPYDERRRRGFLRHVLIRTDHDVREILVTLVCTSDVFPSRKAFISELIRRHPAIRTVALNVNRRQTSVVLGKEERILYGRGFITDELLGKTFAISSSSFYQINHRQCERLYQKAYDLLRPDPRMRVLDAYCGIGTIGLCIADSIRTLTGVEINAQAVKDARENARRNHADNARFLCADATRFIMEESRRHAHYDAIILDPPREGSTPAFLDACAALGPDRIIYISCNPLTQIRDLRYIMAKGYQCSDMYLFDMFPMSDDTESLCLLTRRR